MKKIIAGIIAVGLMLVGYSLLTDQKPLAPSEEVPQILEEFMAVSENIIVYADDGFTPKSLSVKAGEEVVFKNNSPRNMWPASAFHPTHKEYPTSGGCLGSAFDACRGISPGSSWSFKFDISGNWKYHDHLQPKYFGEIIVENE